MTRTRRLLWLVPLAVVALAVVGFAVWVLTPLGPTDAAVSALETGDGVTVSEAPWGWRFAPASGEASSGLVLFPGGRVDFRSYAPLARGIAEKGHVVALVRVPLSLAITDPDVADGPIGTEPSVRWSVGGHSLGGVAAAMYAADHTEVAGLVLLASYPSGSGLSARHLLVSDIRGSQDHVLDMANWKAARGLLPRSAEVLVIQGGNHAQFGDYGEQPGDGRATIPASTQQSQTIETIDRLLDRTERR